MKGLVFASCALMAATSPSPNKLMLFEGFMEKYDRHYATEFEKGKRFQIFSENVDVIYASNAENRSFTLGITEGADQTWEEWRSVYLNGITPAPLTASRDRALFTKPEGFAEPDSMDWVAKGGVTEVKTQGTCGSCWTFSTAGALEGAMHVAGRTMVDLSMQHILACDTGGHGCQGGFMAQAFGWVAENGLPALKDEPYLCVDASSSECKGMTCSACQAATGDNCNFGGCNKVPGSVCNKDGFVHRCECPKGQCFRNGQCGGAEKPAALAIAVGDVTTHTDVAQTEGALEAAVAQQPVSVLIEATNPVFQHYTGGVLTSDRCGNQQNHAVLTVGYGVDNGQKYWKVKNSWGSSWGEKGYIRIEKGKPGDRKSIGGGECGIRKTASFPTIKKASSDSTIVV